MDDCRLGVPAAVMTKLASSTKNKYVRRTLTVLSHKEFNSVWTDIGKKNLICSYLGRRPVPG